MSAPWFTFADLKNIYPYSKIQNAQTATVTYANTKLIPDAMNFVQRYVKTLWSETTVPDDIKGVAMNYAVNLILADDESVKIAQARGQPSFTVAGDTVNLDLTIGRNPFLSTADEAILEFYLDQTKGALHVDKIRVQPDGQVYRDATGRTDRDPLDYIAPDLPRVGWRPPY